MSGTGAIQHPVEVAVSRAAAALRARRDVLATRYATAMGDDGGGVVAVGRDSFHDFLFSTSREWRELSSLRRVAVDADPDELVGSLRNNRRIVGDGLRMTSVFSDYDRPADLIDVLAAQDIPYRLGAAPFDIKIIDDRQVLLEGPSVDGERSLVLVSDASTLALARRYWHAVLRSSATAHERADGRPALVHELTPRQRAVAALMARDASDDQAAEVLGISVRTLRADIADLKRALGVTTRFAAGLELGRRTTAQGVVRGPLQEPAINATRSS